MLLVKTQLPAIENMHSDVTLAIGQVWNANAAFDIKGNFIPCSLKYSRPAFWPPVVINIK